MKIAITGRAGAGKDAVGKILTSKYGFKIARFADPLKNMLRAYYGTLGWAPDQIERRIEGDLKEKPDPYLNGKTPRYAMQTLGQEWGRDLIGKELWVDAFGLRCRNSKHDLVCLDLRYDNEAAEAVHTGFKIFRKLGNSAALGSVESQHGSEKGINPAFFDGEIPWFDDTADIERYVDSMMVSLRAAEGL